LKIKFYAEGLSVANPKWATKRNLFQAQKIDMRISQLSPLFGKSGKESAADRKKQKKKFLGIF